MTRVAAFDPNGARLVATVAWIPASAMIDQESLRIDENGALCVDCIDTRPLWDGAVTETDRGYTLFETRDGSAAPEDDIVLRAVDDAGEPYGDPLPFTATAAAQGFNDTAVMTASQALLLTAEMVVSRWSANSLAEAVRDLDAAARALRRLLPNGPATQAPKTPREKDATP